MDKAPEAFRTISEVADLLETPAHVLRFWESRFPQIKPVKRAGGRRYYRPADVALLSGIRHLLHAEGMTIRGVQKVLRDHGVRHVAGLSGDITDLDTDAEDAFDGDEAAEASVVSARILPMGTPPRRAGDAAAERGTVQPLFKPDTTLPNDGLPNDALASLPPQPGPLANDPARAAKPPGPTVPRDGAGGFIAFSSADVIRSKTPPRAPPAQATLPFDDAPEAPHVWVEADTPLADLTQHPASRPAAPEHPPAQGTPPEQALPDTADADLADVEQAEAEQPDAPFADRHQADADLADTDRADTHLADAARANTDRADTPEADAARANTDRADTPKADAALPEVDRADTPKADLALADTDRADTPEADPALPDTDRADTHLADANLTDTDQPHVPLAAADQPAASPADPSDADPPDSPHAQHQPDLSGLAHRLRALKGPLSPASAQALAELHPRLGLLHAQMAEALRLRR